MNRRQLFGSLLALLTMPVAFARRMHRLYCDGVHDDTEALQALVNGESVWMPDGSIHRLGRGRLCTPLVIQTGTYKVTATLQLPAQTGAS